jgi:hypothetical protein
MSTSARYRVVLTGIAEGEALYIADIDLLGKETVQGPYAIDAEYGSNPTEVLYDWTQSRLEVENLQQSIRGNAPTVAKLAVSTRGMQRVTHEQLLAGGVDLSGVAAAQIAVITDTGPVPRRMRGPATFGAGSSIEFFGDARDSLWSSGRIYSVLNDASRATDMSLVSRVVASQGVSTYAAELKYAPQVGYYEGSSTGDPWYADRMVANGAATEKQVALSGPAPSNSSGTVEVVLGGGIDWPGSTPDHSVQILLNGSPIATRRWDGVGQARLRIPVVVGSGVNSVTVRLPLDTGFAADIVYIESVTLKYRASASGNGTVFQGKGILGSAWDTVFADTMGDGSPPSIAGAITIGNVSGTDVRAFQVRGGGAVEFAVSGTPLTFYSASFVDDAEMWVGASSAFLTPTVQAAPTAGSLFGAPADWLVISHGAFMPALGDLVARRQSQGLTTKVVDVADVMLKYSAGNPTPESLRRYIADAKSQMGTDYVLLVGADSYDAPGYLSSGSVSFIPTPYATTSAFVRFAPADPLIADTNGDQVPDVAIGRLPVRTLAETQEAVRKILAYETQAASSMQLTAGALDPLGSFQNASESFATGLPVTWQLDRAYVDALGLNPARTALVNSFNQGRSVISYMGHSGPFQWGLTQSKQFDISQVLGTSSNADLPNLLVSQNQPIVLQFACWTTYFVHPSQSTMAQALLLTPNKGASAILGATVVLDQASHDRMAAAMADRLIPGARIGDVMQAAKAELAADANNPAGPEIQFGQILLGDPAQPIR